MDHGQSIRMKSTRHGKLEQLSSDPKDLSEAHQGTWVLNGYFFPTSPLLVGYIIRDWYMMVSESNLRP